MRSNQQSGQLTDSHRASWRPIRTSELIRVWAAFIIPITLLVLVVLLLEGTGLPALIPPGFLWALTVLLTVLTAFTVWLSVRRWSPAELGFTRLGRRGFHLIWQVPLVLFAALAATALVGSAIGLQPAEDTSTGTVETPVVALLVLVAYLVLGPVVEEVLVRRFTMYWTEEKLLAATGRPRLAVVGSVVLSSVVFAAMHVVAPVMLWTFFLGVGCAVLTRFHRSLWGGLTLHCTANLIASAALLPVFLGAG